MLHRYVHVGHTLGPLLLGEDGLISLSEVRHFLGVPSNVTLMLCANSLQGYSASDEACLNNIILVRYGFQVLLFLFLYKISCMMSNFAAGCYLDAYSCSRSVRLFVEQSALLEFLTSPGRLLFKCQGNTKRFKSSLDCWCFFSLFLFQNCKYFSDCF